MFFLVTASYRKVVKEDYLDKNPNAGDKYREVSLHITFRDEGILRL